MYKCALYAQIQVPSHIFSWYLRHRSGNGVALSEVFGFRMILKLTCAGSLWWGGMKFSYQLAPVKQCHLGHRPIGPMWISPTPIPILPCKVSPTLVTAMIFVHGPPVPLWWKLHWVAATGNASGESTSGADSPWDFRSRIHHPKLVKLGFPKNHPFFPKIPFKLGWFRGTHQIGINWDSIILILMGFSLPSHPAMGVPPWLWKSPNGGRKIRKSATLTWRGEESASSSDFRKWKISLFHAVLDMDHGYVGWSHPAFQAVAVSAPCKKGVEMHQTLPRLEPKCQGETIWSFPWPWGYPNSWSVQKGKSSSKMDDLTQF